MIQIATTAGSLEITDFKHFLSQVEVKDFTNNTPQYNRQESAGDFVDGGLVDASYTRMSVTLKEPSFENDLASLLRDTQFTPTTPSKSFNDLIEDLSLVSMENFGLPSHVVKINDNLIGVFCLDDFRIYKHGDKQALVCYRRHCNLITQV